MSPILFLFVCTILLQQITAPAQQTEEISKKELERTLLKEAKNLAEVEEILHLARTNPQEARNRMHSYKKKQYSKELKWLLSQIIETPEKMYVLMRPIFVAMHKRLEEESSLYQTVSTPLWNFAEGLGLVWLRIMGITISSVGEVTQIINNILKAGTTAYYGETPKEKVFESVHKGAEKIKWFGDKLDNDGKAGLRNASVGQNFKKNSNAKNGVNKSE